MPALPLRTVILRSLVRGPASLPSPEEWLEIKILSLTGLLENGLEDTGRGKGKLGQSERVSWTYIHYQM